MLQTYLDRLLAGDPVLLGIVGGLALVLLILLVLRIGRRAALRRAPRLELSAFQLSPLGRDALLKVRNLGEAVTLTQLSIYGRQDVAIKNTIAGHVLPPGSSYRILLESSGEARLRADFEVEFVYATAGRKAYRQRFRLDPVEEVKLRKV
jgi:hypothetical protein